MPVEFGGQPFEEKLASSFTSSSEVNAQAESLAAGGQYLELVPDPNHIERPRLRGFDLKHGMVVYRGDVKEIDAPRGGTYYIDGDVELLEGDMSGGIVYINGNLTKLKNTGSTILVITGDVEEYDQDYQSSGGLSLPITHSPFLFSSNPIKGSLMTYSTWPGKHTEIEPGMVVDIDRLTNWDPRDTVVNALELCRERISSENDRRMEVANSLTTPTEMARFYVQKYEGYTVGYSRGQYEAPNSIDMD